MIGPISEIISVGNEDRENWLGQPHPISMPISEKNRYVNLHFSQPTFCDFQGMNREKRVNISVQASCISLYYHASVDHVHLLVRQFRHKIFIEF